MRKLTREEFIERASKIHNNKYDYSKCIFIGMKNKVEIICQIHESFWQHAGAHIRQKQGCPICAKIQRPISNTKTTEYFISLAKIAHPDKNYDYSLVNYKGRKKVVSIICPTHGVFNQKAFNHLSGNGCYLCGNESTIINNTKTTDEFIKEAISIHGGRYNYDLVQYKGSVTEIIIVCNIHGEFKQMPGVHLLGCGCRRCGVESAKLLTIKGNLKFINEAMECHGNKYTYEKVNYTNALVKVIITCQVHGDFDQRPDDHIHGHGCPKCAREAIIIFNTKGLEDFINQAKLLHKNKYDYSLVDYINTGVKIIITCSTHGEFNQTPHAHLGGQGCPKCAHRVSAPSSFWLDSLNIPDDSDHREVLIITKDKKFKVDGYDPETNTIYEFNGDYYHGNPIKFNHNKIFHGTTTFGDLYNKTINKESQLKEAGFNVISIWESDWNLIRRK